MLPSFTAPTAADATANKFAACITVLVTEGPERSRVLGHSLGLSKDELSATLADPAVAEAYKKLGPPEAKRAAPGDAGGSSKGGDAKRSRPDGQGAPKMQAPGHWQPSAAYAAYMPQPAMAAPLPMPNWGGPMPAAPAWQHPMGAMAPGPMGGSMMKGKCRHCGQPGHYARECPSGGAAQYGQRPPM